MQYSFTPETAVFHPCIITYNLYVVNAARGGREVHFGKKLRSIRIEKNRKQQEVADAISVALRSYQKYEQGIREPSLTTLVALADFLEVSTDRLLGRED